MGSSFKEFYSICPADFGKFSDLPVVKDLGEKNERMREIGKPVMITDLMNQYLMFNEKPLKRQQWGKLALEKLVICLFLRNVHIEVPLI